ncbi:MAG: hypothetical protein Q4E05_04735 [Pseudoclavibacter sp.]|nr:hypothetical protein [Pseudoclavibacter sp.]
MSDSQNPSTPDPNGSEDLANAAFTEPQTNEPQAAADAAPSLPGEQNAAAAPDATAGAQGPGYGQAADPYGTQNSFTAPDYGQGSTTPGTDPYGTQNSFTAADPYAQSSTAASDPGAQTSGYGQAADPYGAGGYGGAGAYAAPSAYPASPSYPAADPYAQPVYTGAAQPSSTVNVMGIISLIVGGIGLLIALIPFIGMMAVIFGLAGVVLAILGLALKRFNAKKGLAIAGAIVSAIALIASIANPFLWAATFTTQSLSEITVVIEAEGTEPFDVDYTVENSLDGSDKYEKSEVKFDQTTRFEMTHTMKVRTDFDLSSASINVTSDNYRGQMSCKITVNGTVVDQQEDTGFAYCHRLDLYSYTTG